MKRFVLLGLMGVMNATVCMYTTAADGANNVLQLLGVSNTNVAALVAVATFAATVYTFLETAYRRYDKWVHSADPKKVDFNSFVKDLALDSLSDIGVVTYEDLNAAIQSYLISQGYAFTRDEVKQIAHDIAQQIVDGKAAQLATRIDLLEQAHVQEVIVQE